MTNQTIRPWYREPWPWVIIGSIGTVVVACFVTLGIAIWSDDGLVVDDYYKKGLAINKTMAREERSAILGLSASLLATPDEGVQVNLHGKAAAFEPPKTLHLLFAHPRFSDRDREVTLTQTGGGVYTGHLALPPEGHWRVVLEGDDWRLPILQVQAPITDLLWEQAANPMNAAHE